MSNPIDQQCHLRSMKAVDSLSSHVSFPQFFLNDSAKTNWSCCFGLDLVLRYLFQKVRYQNHYCWKCQICSLSLITLQLHLVTCFRLFGLLEFWKGFRWELMVEQYWPLRHCYQDLWWQLEPCNLFLFMWWVYQAMEKSQSKFPSLLKILLLVNHFHNYECSYSNSYSWTSHDLFSISLLLILNQYFNLSHQKSFSKDQEKQLELADYRCKCCF